jgi:predicted amidohydrolase
MEAVKVAAIQHDIVWLDRTANFSHLESLISEAAGNGARLVVLTEMFSTGFAMGDEWADSLPEPTGGPSSSFLHDMAQRYGVWIAGSCPERRDAEALPANTLVIASPAGAMHRYEKIHPFSYGGEDRYFRAGSQPLTVDIEGLAVSAFVCYDLRFADHFWNLAATTDLFIVPANWPASRAAHWKTLLEARAIENQAYVVGVNRVGSGGSLVYGGGSRIVGPFGEDLASAGDGETIIYADVTKEHVASTRRTYPFLRDR